ncbi:hypothetical protein McpSp1_09040 [Methanocorpusculaceae archaeon Sp1]|nr:hypothetical protein [Methanocorpusculaceae archaeon Sp1]
MLETWSAAEIILGFIVACTCGGPVVYAWADRWLDRTRNKITDVVTSEKED